MLKPNEGFPEGYDWGLYPGVQKFMERQVNAFLSRHSFAKNLASRMLSETSTRFIDWIDHIILPESRAMERQLKKLGFEEIDEDIPENARMFRHTKTYFFPVLLSKSTEIAIKPEHLIHFLQVIGHGIDIEGEPLSAFRRAVVKKEGNFVLSAVERRGYNGFIVKDSKDTTQYAQALDTFFCRKRFFASDNEGMKFTENLVKSAIKKLKPSRVADAFFRAERLYWERRNRAGQVQKARQDRLGLGWGNHDHHTYRSSRENFSSLVRIFEKMGYLCREKFYAGEEASWGAQILEHPICDIVIFCDVDLFPEEREIDFAHSGLKHRTKLGTVGLWVGLHGESMLQAGMHHLEARFDFEKLRADLAGFGVNTMNPFSYFGFLKQAFTEGERWSVEKHRLDKLLKDSSINKLQYNNFMKNGAIGSHMENLQRRQGFKGFNQRSVSAIIKATDPRTYSVKYA